MTSANNYVRRVISFFADKRRIFMLFSIALILFFGFSLGELMRKLKQPPLLGMIITGIILGPVVLNLIDSSILSISTDLRQIALIVILIRAGLALQLNDLKKVGRPAILMCFLPASFELAAYVIFAPALLGISYLEAAIMGTVLAAVSPAVVVPRMLQLMENQYGVYKKIPQLIMAGASVDDIFVIVLFTAFIGMYQGKEFSFFSLIKIPISILLGLTIGVISGFIIVWILRKFHVRDTVKVLLLLAVSFLFVSLETAAKPLIPISGLLAVMALGAIILKKHDTLARRLSIKFSKLWIVAELILFVLVGASVDIRYVGRAGIMAICLIIISLLFRIVGVFACLIKTNLTWKERAFTAIAYLPKATVQAAIGSMPLALGLPAGNTILTVAVLAILITAPIGAIGIDFTYQKLLSRDIV